MNRRRYAPTDVARAHRSECRPRLSLGPFGATRRLRHVHHPIRQFVSVAVALLVLFVAQSPSIAQSEQPDTPSAESEAPLETRQVERLVDEIGAANPPILAHPMVLLLDELQSFVAVSEMKTVWTRLESQELHPLVDALARWRHAGHLQSTGEDAQAAAALDGLGMLTKWHVVGPFAHSATALEDRFEPEERIDVDTPVDGMFDGLRWRAIDGTPRAGYVRLSSVIEPTADAVMYLATVVESPRAQDAVLWLTVDGTYRVWAGGELVGESEDDEGGHIDRDGFRIRLAKGANLVLVKVANDAGHAGIYARLTDTALAPLELEHGVRRPTLDQALPAELVERADARRVPGAIELLEAHLQESVPVEARTIEENSEAGAWGADDAEGADEAGEPTETELEQQRTSVDPVERAHALAWTGYALHQMYPEDVSRPGESWMLEALSLTPADSTVVALAMRTLEESWRRREVLERALDENPADTRLKLLRVEELLRGATFDRADDLETLLDSLRERQPRSTRVELAVVQWLVSQGLSEAAWETLAALAARAPDTPAVLEELQWRAATTNRPATRRDVLTSLLAIRHDADSLRTELATLHHQAGDAEAALGVLSEGLRRRPDAHALAVRKIDILTALGRSEEAEAAWRDLIERTPTSARLHELHGNWLFALGERTAALEAYRRSLHFAAQNETLRQMVRYLDPETESFEQPWLVEDLESLQPTWGGEDYGVALEQKIVLVHPNGLSSTYFQTVYDVLTEEGASALRYLPVFYTPEEEVLEIDAVRVTKPDGTVREVYEKHEFPVADESIRMYYDYRRVVIELADLAEGDRLEVRYRRSQTSQTNYFDNHFGDVWFLQSTEPKHRVRYVLITPKDRPIQMREPERLEVEHRTEEREEHVVHVLERTGVPKIEAEHMMPGFAELSAYAIFSTFDGWEEVAEWYYDLARDQWIVDREIARVVEGLTRDVTDRREIVSRIHNYVVKNTRYVALEFGVHGYKPYRTTVCFRRRFGDCKDKASLIKVMLEEAGIPTDIVLVRTRRNGEIATDPATLRIFDHAIAYVPEFDLFLDGTAEFSGTEELPAMDQGITVLIVKDEGEWELRETPVLPPESSRVVNDYTIDLDVDGAMIEGEGRISGQFAPGYRKRYESEEKRHDVFEEELASEYPGAELTSLRFGSVDDLESPVEFEFVAEVDALVERSGDALLLYPHGHRADLTQRLTPTPSREQDLMLPFPFVLENEITYALPEGYVLDDVPEPIERKTPFGEFELEILQDGTEIRVDSRLRLDVMRVEQEKYVDFQRWVRDAERLLNKQMRLVPAARASGPAD